MGAARRVQSGLVVISFLPFLGLMAYKSMSPEVWQDSLVKCNQLLCIRCVAIAKISVFSEGPRGEKVERGDYNCDGL